MGRRRAEAADPSLSLHFYRKREENGGRMNRWRAEAANPPLFPPSAKENEGKWGRMGRRRMEAADPPLVGVASRIMGPSPPIWPYPKWGHPPYLVLSKMRGSILDKVAFPRVCFYTKGGVAFRIMGPFPLSGSIQNEGGISDHGPIPPYLKLSKMRGAILGLVHLPLIGSIQNEGLHPGSWCRPPLSGPILNER